MRRVVVLGGGVGGVTAAVELSKRLSGQAAITLIDREGRHFFPPSYPWVMMGWRNPDRVWRPLTNLKARGVTIRAEDVLAIDPAERQVKTASGVYPYDYLLISLGAQLEPEVIEGFAKGAHHFYDLPDAVRLGEALRRLRQGKLLLAVSRLPFKCPAAPYEVALLIDALLRKRGLRGQVEMVFYTPEPWPTPAAGPSIGQAIEGMLRDRGIEFHGKKEMSHVDTDSRTVHFKGNGQEDYDLLVAVPPHTTCEAVRTSGLAKDGPWIPVDPRTMRTTFDDVYAVGDVTKIPTPSGNVPFLPKAGVFAEGQAKVAARNIAAQILGGATTRWDGHGVCFLETGFGRAGMVQGNFYGDGPPPVRMRSPSHLWHWGKVLVEWRWWGKLFR